MSREIVEALHGLEQEKGIDAETLMEALEDALLSAYKKSPGAAKYARVDLDRNTADFRVFELIALERPAAETLRLYIDHPSGVDLALCERVTNHFRDLLEAWSLEVSSPGVDRPLTKPQHYRRYVGRRVRVRTEQPVDGRRNFTGTLTDADDESVSLDAEGSTVRIPLTGIRRSNLVPDLEGGISA